MLKWFILYYLFCLGYVIFSLWKKRENGLIKGILITFVPVLGFILSFLLFRKPRNIQYEGSGEDNDDILFSSISARKINVEREINIIPYQEVLLSNDNDHKRSMLIDGLKDGADNIDIFYKAIKSDDTETVHYAATSIMEIQKKFLISLHELMKRMEENPSDYEAIDKYAETLKRYVDSNMVDQEAKMQYRNELSGLLEHLLESPIRSKKHFIEKINNDLEIGELEKSRYYSELFMEEFPDDEMSYLLAMKVSYMMQNAKDLHEIMDKLKRTPIQLSPTGINALHFWS